MFKYNLKYMNSIFLAKLLYTTTEDSWEKKQINL